MAHDSKSTLNSRCPFQQARLLSSEASSPMLENQLTWSSSLLTAHSQGAQRLDLQLKLNHPPHELDQLAGPHGFRLAPILHPE